MSELENKERFVTIFFDNVKKLFGSDKVRLYAIELPVYTSDGEKFADMVLEIDLGGSPMLNPMMVLEFKKNTIDTGAVEQVERYRRTIKNQLYRKSSVDAYIIGPDFSNFELQMCKEMKQKAIQYNPNTGELRFA